MGQGGVRLFPARTGAVTLSDRIAPPHPYTLHVGNDSVLRLPVVERGDAAFFEPPA